MEAMVQWHREGYIDPGVWEKLIRNKVNPALILAPSVLQLPPPPGGTIHPILQLRPPTKQTIDGEQFEGSVRIPHIIF